MLQKNYVRGVWLKKKKTNKNQAETNRNSS